MKIEIVKPYKCLIVGQTLNVDACYSSTLISKGFAKSLESVNEIKVVDENKKSKK